MSQEVDSRVVEMRFDNANFEKNTKQTISTIDRLMEKLQFKGAEKGFEKLGAAAENVDFATMQTSLDRLESKFSSLNIVATTALVNITNNLWTRARSWSRACPSIRWPAAGTSTPKRPPTFRPS